MPAHYARYYLQQSGGGGGGDGSSSSNGGIGMIYHSPQVYQRGRGGVGNFFSGLFQRLQPLMKSGLTAVKNQSLKTGSAILNDLAENKNIKSVIKEQGLSALNELKERGLNKLKRKLNQDGDGGKCIKRVHKSSSHPLLTRTSHAKPKKSIKKKKSHRVRDIFDN